MNWKVFLTASISFFLVSFPQNMIGCGGSEDPYDYYTSFFNKNVSEAKGYRPFYYTSLLTFYDDWMQNEPSYADDKVVSEWIKYTTKNIPDSEAGSFIYSTSKGDAERILTSITKKDGPALPDSLSNNGMARYFIETKDATALQYLVFAKDIQQFTTTNGDWDAKPARDSLLLNEYIYKAGSWLAKTKENFIKTKYAFQRCKLAFYNYRYADCVKWCDEIFTNANGSAVKQLAISYKAGSLYRLGRKAEAAYTFSKAFSETVVDKKKIFLGFLWATDFCNKELEAEYTTLCKNNEEKANMLGMFALYGVDYRLETIQTIYALNHASPLLDILAIREINKLEQQYLTPLLNKEKGGKAYYLSWGEDGDTLLSNGQVQKTISLFESLANDTRIYNRGLYYAGAAYAAFMNKDYIKTKQLIASAKKIRLTDKVADQLQLINLLTEINEKKQLDAANETAILSSIKWLEEKAKKDEEYTTFYRNLFSEIIAQKYQQQKESYKAALAFGAADMIGYSKEKPGDSEYPSYSVAIDFVRSEMNTDQISKLYTLLDQKNTSPYESYLITHTSFSKSHVIDVMGTSYLRDFNFKKAVEWLKKSNNSESLETDNYNYTTEKESHVNVNPFYDYINDWNRYDKSLDKPMTKLSLAQKLLELQSGLDTVKTAERKSKVYYQLATAFYNMSYYGNTWMAVAYERSTSNWNEGKYSTSWEKEYFGVYKAGQYYHKAYELSANKEFKAAALFLEAKCLQRQIPLPSYSYNNSDNYEKEQGEFQKKFMNNVLFPKFRKEFGDTKFYKYASNRCSYLRDFVNKK